MTWYVALEGVNGRYNFYQLVHKLHERGYTDKVEYFQGGWMDREVGTVKSHLKFEDEQDALAYALATGGKVSREVPLVEEQF